MKRNEAQMWMSGWYRLEHQSRLVRSVARRRPAASCAKLEEDCYNVLSI